MSPSIDERVVQMQFDNQKFEKNARTTIKTLGDLEKSLDLKGSTKGFEELEKAAKSLDLSSASQAVDAITNKFSVLGTIGDQVLRNLTNRAADFAVKFAKSLTIDQISSGWKKYEAKTQAVQVIMHATKMNIEDVNAVLDDLTKYTDDTSYHFDQMVDAMSKFTQVGVKLDDAEKAAEGIANWAAVSGVSASDAARAFTNLSQAMSLGALTTKDWTSIESLQMSNKEFKEKAIEVAQAMIDEGRASEEMAAAFKKAQPNINNFRDSLSYKWLDKQVMMETFQAYADRTTEFGNAAFQAAYEAKSFTDAVDAAKEAVSSGWANIFEQIFGNYEEAKVFWTEVADALINTFSAPTNALAELLTSWHEQGGYVAFIESIRNSWAAVQGVAEAVGETFREIFPGIGADKLVEVTQKLENLTSGWKRFASKIDIESLKLPAEELKALQESGEDLSWYFKNLEEAEKHNQKVDENLKALKETAQGFFSLLNLGKTVTVALFKMAVPFLRLLAPIGRLVGTITSALGRFSTTIVNAILQSETFNNILSFLEKVVNNLVSGIEWLTNNITELIDKFLKIPVVKAFVGLLTTLGKTIKELAAPYFAKAVEYLENFVDIAKRFISDHLADAFDTVAQAISNFAEEVPVVAEDIKNFLIPVFTRIWQEAVKVWGWIKKLGTAIYTFWKEQVEPTEIFQSIKNKVAELGSKITEFFTKIVEFIRTGGIKAVFEWLRSELDNLVFRLRHLDIAGAFKELLQAATLVKLVSLIMTIMKITRTLGQFSSFLKKFPKSLQSFSKGLGVKRVAQSLLLLAAALYVLSLVPEKRLLSLSLTLGALALGLIAFALALSFVTGLLSKKELIDNKAMGKAILGMLAIAISMLLLATALKKISDIQPEKLWPSVWAMFAIMAALGAATLATSLGGEGLKSLGIGLLAITASVILLLFALDKLKEALSDLETDEPKITRAVIIISAIAVSLIAMAWILKKVSGATWQMAALIASIGVSILLISFAVSRLAKMGPEELEKAGEVLLALVIALGILALVTRLVPKGAGKTLAGMALSIIAIGASVWILANALKTLGEMDAKTAEDGMERLVTIMELLAVVLLSASFIRAKGGVLFGLAAVIFVLVASLSYLAKQDFDKILAAAMLLSAVMLAFSASMGIAMTAFHGDYRSILGIALIIAALVAGLEILSTLESESVLTSAIAIGIVLLTLGTAMKKAGKFSASTSLGAMGMWIATLMTIMLALVALSHLPVPNLIASTIALGVLLEVLTACMNRIAKNSASYRPGVAGPLLGMITAVLLPLVVAIAVVAAVARNTDTGSFIATIAAIAILVPIMAGVAKLLSTIKSGPNLAAAGITLLSVIVILAAVTAALAIAANNIKDPSGLVSIATAMATVMAAMILPIAAVMAIGKLGGDDVAISGLIGFARIVAGLILVFGIIGTLTDLMKNLVGFDLVAEIQTAGKVLEAVGEAIGGLIGGVIAGIGDAVINKMPSWGMKIAMFLTSIATGMATLSAIPNIEGNMNGIEALAHAILTLTANNILESLTNWITGGTDFTAFADSIAKLGPSLHDFAEATKDVNAESVSGAADAIESLANVAGTLQRHGGLIQKAIGEVTTLGEFADELGHMIKGKDGSKGGLVVFAEAAPDIAKNGNAITDVSKAIGDMSDLAASLGRSGGWIDAVLGKAQTLGEFADELAKAAPNFSTFAQKAPEIAVHKEEISQVATVIGELVKVAQAIPTTNTEFLWGGLIENTQTLGEFMAQFADTTISIEDSVGAIPHTGPSELKKKGIGTILAEFISSIGEIGPEDYTKLDNVTRVLEGLIKLAEPLQGKEKTLSIFGSDVWTNKTTNGLTELLQSLAKAGPIIQEFSTKLDVATMGKFNTVATALVRLAEAEVSLADISSPGYALYDFASNLLMASDDIREASSALADVDYEAMDTLFSWMQDNYSEVSDQGVAAIEELASTISTEGNSQVPESINEVLSNMVDEMQNASNTIRYHEAGKYLVSGFVAGINENLSMATAAASHLGEATIQQLRKTLRIASPSKVMRRLGGFVGEGFVLGVNDWLGTAASASDNLAQSMTNSAMSALDYIQRLLDGDLVYDMTIRPVIDLTNVQSGVATIDSMFSQRQAILAQIDADTNRSAEIDELVTVGWQILKEIQNGRDIYLDGKVLAGSMNKRLGRMEG